jgi:hypothetical protein
LLARGRRIEGSALQVLDPVDQLVHVALHAALAGANRLIWMVDVDRLVARRTWDWPELIAATRESRTGLPVALSLARARTMLGTAIPDAVLPEIAGGRAWLSTARAVDSRSLLKPDPSRPGASIALARSVQASAWRSQIEFVRHGIGWLLSGAPKIRLPVDWVDPESDNSTLHPVPDMAARAAYFTAVQNA